MHGKLHDRQSENVMSGGSGICLCRPYHLMTLRKAPDYRVETRFDYCFLYILENAKKDSKDCVGDGSCVRHCLYACVPT